MIQPANQNRAMITTMTCGIHTELTPEELYRALTELHQKMKTPDPENPGLWSTTINDHTVWGILDEHAGPNGEDVFTVLFPHEY